MTPPKPPTPTASLPASAPAASDASLEVPLQAAIDGEGLELPPLPQVAIEAANLAADGDGGAAAQARLIQRDIDALRAVPVTDIASLMVRLDSVAAALDQLPMLSGADAPVQPGSEAASPAGATAPARDGAGAGRANQASRIGPGVSCPPGPESGGPFPGDRGRPLFFAFARRSLIMAPRPPRPRSRVRR